MTAPTPLSPLFRRRPEADRRARWFSRILFFRDPLPEEDEEFIAAVEWMRRRRLRLLLGYAAFVAVAVLPGLLRDRSAAYYATALLGPHLVLYLLVMMTAYGWVGYRVNLGTLREHWPQLMRRQGRQLSLVSLGLWAAAGGVVGFVSARADTGAAGWDSASLWMHETFTPSRLLLLFIVLITALPEIIAQLRLRQQALLARAAAAETASERLARQTAESELRLLQAQVEPHFLYNTLANLRFLVQTGAPDALRMTDALIDYLRSSVPDMRAARVTLGREADHARNYLEIMRLRMGGRLAYEIDIPPALRQVELPPLVLLTLVENAVKHGIAPQVAGGRVLVRVRPGDGGRVAIEVEDDGVGLGGGAAATAGASTGTGLDNVRERLRLVYGDAGRVVLERAAPHGTRARIELPGTQTAPATPDHKDADT